MPNRIIKESICTSDNLDGLSWFEEVLFYRLIVNCDDYGRFDGRPAIIKNRLFPLKENLTVKAVAAAVNTLASAELVALYEFEGKPYLYLPTWNEHQTIRAKRSRYPSPEDGVQTSEIICMQMHADESKCSRNPIQSESNPNTESEARAREAAERVSAFDSFWKAYPKKVGKADAHRAFVKVPKDIWPKLVPAVEKQKQSRQWQIEGGRYIPNPSTWLNQGRWDDEPTDNRKPSQIAGTGAVSRKALEEFMGREA